jgi:hypothetical protein
MLAEARAVEVVRLTARKQQSNLKVLRSIEITGVTV